MSDEIKSVVEAGLKGVGDKLEAAITKFEGQYAEAGKTDNEIKAACAALSPTVFQPRVRSIGLTH